MSLLRRLICLNAASGSSAYFDGDPKRSCAARRFALEHLRLH